MFLPIKNGMNHDHGIVHLDSPPCYAFQAYLNDFEAVAFVPRVFAVILILFFLSAS